MLTIDFQDEDSLLPEDSEDLLQQIEEIIQYTYVKHSQLQENNLEMSILFVTNAEIKEINAQYRDKDSETDVISFALLDVTDNIIFDDTMPQILGEIFISIEKAQQQAIDYGHSFRRELTFLALHGFLHLLGYDHMNDSDATLMFGLQEQILNEFGIERE